MIYTPLFLLGSIDLKLEKLGYSYLGGCGFWGEARFLGTLTVGPLELFRWDGIILVEFRQVRVPGKILVPGDRRLGLNLFGSRLLKRLPIGFGIARVWNLSGFWQGIF